MRIPSSKSFTCLAILYSGLTGCVGSTYTVALSGPSSADFDLYLQKKSGNSWSTVSRSEGYSSTESITYAGTSGTYRVKAYSYSGTGSYTVTWCR